jgi:hypothetical protein
MNEATATLLAAIIAALVSIIVLLVQVFSSTDAEARGAHRQIIETYLAEIAEALHSIIATSEIMMKTKSDASYNEWKRKAHVSQEKLRSIRGKVRYPLWGIDEGLRVMIRVPNWITHFKKRVPESRKVLDAADALSIALDNAIRYSYSRGRPPTFIERWIVGRKAKALRSLFEKAMRNKTKRS